MNLADRLAELDKIFESGWVIERHDTKYNVTLLDKKTTNVYCGCRKDSIFEAIDSALEKYNNNVSFYDEYTKAEIKNKTSV